MMFKILSSEKQRKTLSQKMIARTVHLSSTHYALANRRQGKGGVCLWTISLPLPLLSPFLPPMLFQKASQVFQADFQFKT